MPKLEKLLGSFEATPYYLIYPSRAYCTIVMMQESANNGIVGIKNQNYYINVYKSYHFAMRSNIIFSKMYKNGETNSLRLAV